MYKLVDDIQLPGRDEVIHNFVSFQRRQGDVGGTALGAVFFTGHVYSAAKAIIGGIDSI